MALDKQTLKSLYETMARIRAFEERVRKEFAAGKLPGFVHLYAGQEAVAAGVCACLRPTDYIVSNHRGHGHCIAKGVDPKGMMAELYGRATGTCKGKGGSMHIADIDKGMLGANGIVGAGFPLACGPGLTAKVKGTDQVSVCFFGDGATNQGTFHESVNLAAIWKLPVIFVAENNGYAEATPVSYAVSVPVLADRAQAYGIPGVTVDGMNVVAVHEAAAKAVARARAGEGPTLLECKTYRYYGHFEGDAQSYKTKEEVQRYRDRDPLRVFRQQAAETGSIPSAELDAIDAKAAAEIAAAVAFAESSPEPRPEDTFTDVYVSY
ncbi:MAG: thiamine pyrophosphate-dependent dehydrogenase E1 component subunit alpha [Candidatus Rokubacteria bacterium]|nr:thiamine pyrophosphate-dependent dehydrogenase E1 component subunit alpha [Candidatus Rokubacteria bacterium]MBI4628352.1 thiamine pyrophosphate-dependent dehydrogenase E1 component subunit alpha [Candidatus Rokubacteria bacterium]